MPGRGRLPNHDNGQKNFCPLQSTEDTLTVDRLSLVQMLFPAASELSTVCKKYYEVRIGLCSSSSPAERQSLPAEVHCLAIPALSGFQD